MARNLPIDVSKHDVCVAFTPLIRNHIKDLIPLLKLELNNDYQLDDHTKCLYTAVIMMALYFGKAALKDIEKCDVTHVRQHYGAMLASARTRNPKSDFDPSTLFVDQIIQSIFNPTKKQRYIYYIMITNAHVSKPSQPDKQILFPGHVFVIEKYPSGRYHIYQSYINQYDINGHYEKNNNSFVIAKQTLQTFLKAIRNLYEHGTWTQETSDAWRQVTHVEASEFNGTIFKNKSHFCFRCIPIRNCATRLISIIDNAERNNVRVDDKVKRLKQTLESANIS